MTETNTTVRFVSGGIECAAFCAAGHFGLNMRTCIINLGETVQINLEYLPDRCRVSINDGQVWFDTDEVSAARIEHLFQTGVVPG